MIRCFAWKQPIGVPFITSVRCTSPSSIRISASCSSASSSPPSSSSSSVGASRRSVSLSIIAASSFLIFSGCFSSPALAEFSEIPNSGGVKCLDLRIGDGEIPLEGDQIAIHYYGRLAAKQGWRFDSTYDHTDSHSGDRNSREVDESRRDSSSGYTSISRLPEYITRTSPTKFL